ncbi:unnamed protein product [Parnassius mnemosyne]|uniref:EF-hand domain-containing protein n=1 Tax=Parnassius mnemosyne TaxID=213953 RepID=A0AAV1KW74_9NEOP
MTASDIINPIRDLTLRLKEKYIGDIVEWFDNNSEAFSLTDSIESINVISIEKLMQFLELKKFHRREFYYPSYGEVMAEVEKLKNYFPRVLTKEQVLIILDKWVIEANIKHELKLAFRIFDSESRNYLDVDEIRLIVTGFGEPFNDNETLELLRDANVRGDGNVFYEDFVDSLFNMAPELNEIKASFILKV